MGTGGTVNVSGAINLSNVVYTGTNADLVEVRNDANFSGGVVSITFQFLPAESLTQLTANHSDQKTSFSGTIMTASVPEPSSLLLGCTAGAGPDRLRFEATKGFGCLSLPAQPYGPSLTYRAKNPERISPLPQTPGSAVTGNRRLPPFLRAPMALRQEPTTSRPWVTEFLPTA